MKKISQETVNQIINTIVLAIHPHKSFIEINKLVEMLSQLEEIKQEVEQEVKK